MRQEYRVVWQREGMDRPKKKRVGSVANAERLIGILTSPEPWKFLRDTKGKAPDAHFCCSGYACDCGGKTVREWCEERREGLPAITSLRVECRNVEPWIECVHAIGKKS